MAKALFGISKVSRSKRTAGSEASEQQQALDRVDSTNKLTMAVVHDERFIPERQKLDQLSIVKDYAAVPRLEYR